MKRRIQTLALACASVLAMIVALVGVPTSAAAAPPDNEVQRTANIFQYVSDTGTAVFPLSPDAGTTNNGPFWRGAASGSSPGYTYDGNMTFWTQPGTAGTVVNDAAANAVYASSVDGPSELPAYAADGSATRIGSWVLPQGKVWSTSSKAAVTLRLDDPSFAGVVRPLKVSLAPRSALTPVNLWVLDQNSAISTFYGLTLATAKDQHQTIETEPTTGTFTGAVTPGSCILKGPSSSAETMFKACAGFTLSLVDADGQIVPTGTAVALYGTVAGARTQIGTWVSDGSKVTYSITSTEMPSAIEPVSYTAVDTRPSGFSGWWEQSVTLANNTNGDKATYDVAKLYLTPVIHGSVS